jgi:hypothetical protein
MKRCHIYLMIVWFFGLWIEQGVASAKADELKVKEMLTHLDQMWRGDSAHGLMKMSVQTKDYRRSLSLKFWSLGQEYFLLRIEKPKKERGTTTLKRESDLYNYLPKVDRTIKLGAALMSGSWMGSHLSNDDLVQNSKFQKDYKTKILSRSPKVIVLESVPHENAAVVWGKVETRMALPDMVPMSQKFFDETMTPIREMVFADVRTIGRRKIPMKIRVLPLDREGEFTELIYETLEFNTGLKDDFFSLTNLKTVR